MLLRVYLLPAVAFFEVEQLLFHNIDIDDSIRHPASFFFFGTYDTDIIHRAAGSIDKNVFKLRNYHNYPTQSMPMVKGQKMGMTNEGLP